LAIAKQYGQVATAPWPPVAAPPIKSSAHSAIVEEIADGLALTAILTDDRGKHDAVLSCGTGPRRARLGALAGAAPLSRRSGERPPPVGDQRHRVWGTGARVPPSCAGRERATRSPRIGCKAGADPRSIAADVLKPVSVSRPASSCFAALCAGSRAANTKESALFLFPLHSECAVAVGLDNARWGWTPRRPRRRPPRLRGGRQPPRPPRPAGGGVRVVSGPPLSVRCGVCRRRAGDRRGAATELRGDERNGEGAAAPGWPLAG